MNERIKQLAEQAGASQRAGVGGLVFRDSELEKFAELIIKETLMVARVGMEFGPSTAEAVYTYFGVKE